MRECPRCGHTLDNETGFCPGCGLGLGKWPYRYGDILWRSVENQEPLVRGKQRRCVLDLRVMVPLSLALGFILAAITAYTPALPKKAAFFERFYGAFFWSFYVGHISGMFSRRGRGASLTRFVVLGMTISAAVLVLIDLLF